MRSRNPGRSVDGGTRAPRRRAAALGDCGDARDEGAGAGMGAWGDLGRSSRWHGRGTEEWLRLGTCAMRTCTRGCATGWGEVLVWIGIRMGLGWEGDVRLEERGSVGNTCCVDCSCGGGDWWWCGVMWMSGANCRGCREAALT